MVNGKDKRILVVDDEEGSRESFRMILKENHQIFTAKDGEEGLDLLPVETSVEVPDLVEGILVFRHGTILRYRTYRVKERRPV